MFVEHGPAVLRHPMVLRQVLEVVVVVIVEKPLVVIVEKPLGLALPAQQASQWQQTIVVRVLAALRMQRAASFEEQGVLGGRMIGARNYANTARSDAISQ